MRLSDIQTTDNCICAFDQATDVLNVVLRLGMQFSMLNSQQAQLFNRCKEFIANLLLEYFSEQTPERTHVPAQRRFLQLAILTGEFCESRCLIVYIPKPIHAFMHNIICVICG